MTDTPSPEYIRDLGRVEGKVDGVANSVFNLATELKADRDARERRDIRVDEQINSTHSRIGKVEAKLYWFTGAGAVLAWIVAKYDVFGFVVPAAAGLSGQ